MNDRWIDPSHPFVESEIERVISYGGTVIRDVSDYLEEQERSERSRSSSVWDSISDYFSDIYDIAKGAASDVLVPIWDWLTERFNRQELANTILIGDVWGEVDKAIDEVVIGGHEAWDVNQAYIDAYREQASEPAEEGKGLIFNWIDAQLEGIADDFAVAFQHLAPVFASLLEIPAMAFFKYLSFLTQPPGAEEG